MNRSSTKVAVVGAGAIGCYFGGRLAHAGAKVTLIGRAGNVDAIRTHGLLLRTAVEEHRIQVDAATDIAAVRGAELILFCVKMLDTDAAAAAMAPHVAAGAVVLSLQNGVDNAERIRAHIKNDVVSALIYVAVNMPSPGCVVHTGGGDLVIGQLQEARADPNTGTSRLDHIARLFGSAGIAVRISDAIATELWTKLVLNCAYNAVCALTGAPYGKMVEMPEIRALMLDATAEVARVAEAKGIRLPSDIDDAMIRLADTMPQTMSSTAQDIAKGKRTEIDHLNGYVVRQGEALGIATPVNATLNALMKLLERTKLGPSG